MRYYNCSSPQSWRVSFESVQVRRRPLPGATQRVGRGQFMSHACIDGRGCEATFASGSAFIVGPASSVDSLLLEVMVDARCRNIEQLPSVYFRMLGHDFEVSPAEYVLRLPVNGRVQCVTAFMPHRDDANRVDWLLGAPFFRRHIVIFDRRKHRVGLVEKASAANDRGGSPTYDAPEPERVAFSTSDWQI